jgi:hypothetical protein
LRFDLCKLIAERVRLALVLLRFLVRVRCVLTLLLEASLVLVPRMLGSRRSFLGRSGRLASLRQLVLECTESR